MKQRYIDRNLRNTHHINSLLESPAYRTNYLNQNIPELAKSKINVLNKEKEDLIKSYQEFLSATSKRPLNRQKNETYFSGSPDIVDIDSEIQVLRSPDHTPEKESLLKEDLGKRWEDHQKELIAKRESYITKRTILESSPKDYAGINPNIKRLLKIEIAISFKSTHLGIGGREDHGGLILVGSKNLVLLNNRYSYFKKVAGITYTKEGDFVEGETSIALDLTTKEVHDWISKTMDEYYNPQNDPTDKGKRPSDDQPGPSNPNKKIKQEPTNDDLAHIKQEIKDEIKEES